MTQLEKWLVRLTDRITGDMQQGCEPDWSDTCIRPDQLPAAIIQYGKDWDELRRRAAVMLVQARALELRHMADTVVLELGANNPIATAMGGRLWARSVRLEKVAMLLAEADAWPPKQIEVVGSVKEIVQ